MVSARSAAMAFNRLLDADIDARIPVQAARHVGWIDQLRFGWVFVAISSVCVYRLPLALMCCA